MKKKILALTLVFALALALGIGGTVAWLTAQTDSVVNTFTVGDITLSLAETQSTYKIVPGGKDAKDPKLTVTKGSEKCYVYACVENNVKLGDTVVATPNIDSTKWSSIGTTGNKTVYRYYQVVDAVDATDDITLQIFTEVQYSPQITKNDIDTLKNKTIVIQGYAHQSENIANSDYADEAAKVFFGITAPVGP